MPFDATDYTVVTEPKVYGPDNPPKRMSKAIRMAVADVEALLDRGDRYDWFCWHYFDQDDTCVDVEDRCATCTAGAIAARLSEYKTACMEDFGFEWAMIGGALSKLTRPSGADFAEISGQWPAGFSKCTDIDVCIPQANHDPAAFKRDMLALADRLEAEGS